LPSERTLRDYTHFIKPSTGFSVSVDGQLQREAKLDSISSSQRHFCLALDEVKMEDLVFDKHSGEMIGFIDIGDINNQLAALYQSCISDNNVYKPLLTTHMLVFMVCGLLTDLKLPYAQFLALQLQLTSCILLFGVVCLNWKELDLKFWPMVLHPTKSLLSLMATIAN